MVENKNPSVIIYVNKSGSQPIFQYVSQRRDFTLFLESEE